MSFCYQFPSSLLLAASFGMFTLKWRLELLEFLMTHLVRCLWRRHHPKSHLELMVHIQNASSTSFSIVWREGSHSSESSSPYIWPSHLNPKPWFSNWSSWTTHKESNSTYPKECFHTLKTKAPIDIWSTTYLLHWIQIIFQCIHITLVWFYRDNIEGMHIIWDYKTCCIHYISL
jgi:hypothetical protein